MMCKERNTSYLLNGGAIITILEYGCPSYVCIDGDIHTIQIIPDKKTMRFFSNGTFSTPMGNKELVLYDDVQILGLRADKNNVNKIAFRVWWANDEYPEKKERHICLLDDGSKIDWGHNYKYYNNLFKKHDIYMPKRKIVYPEGWESDSLQ